MEKVIQALNELVAEGVIEKYAIGGAVGILFYTEAINTKDVDVFVAPRSTGASIIHLGAIYDYLKKAGHKMKGQYFVIDGIPVDFIAAYNDLTVEALENSIKKAYGRTKVKVFRPEYLLAIAIQTGRSQDLKKVDLLAGEAKLDKVLLKNVLKRHGLYGKWRKYVSG
ncbi:MAG TPA: nucleotidyltransferase [Thermodesulfobacteriota bacterium]|nr:nucleotidyltransferase [Thermodesulfobacteriota bacterium]